MSKVGRPLKFKTPEELEAKINAYFSEIESIEGAVPTITGLAKYLNTSRETLREYKERPEYVDPIKKALSICEYYIENGALTNKLNTVFSIFNLKNNYGWKDESTKNIKAEVTMSQLLNSLEDGQPIKEQVLESQPPLQDSEQKE